MVWAAAWLASVWGYILGPLLAILSVFLILLILIQRGRGGGLIGALGGPGGQSAFGTKAGDVFTRITVVTTCIWLLLCLATIALLNNRTRFRPTTPGRSEKDRAGELVTPTSSSASTEPGAGPSVGEPAAGTSPPQPTDSGSTPGPSPTPPAPENSQPK